MPIEIPDKTWRYFKKHYPNIVAQILHDRGKKCTNKDCSICYKYKKDEEKTKQAKVDPKPAEAKTSKIYDPHKKDCGWHRGIYCKECGSLTGYICTCGHIKNQRKLTQFERVGGPK